MKTGSEEQVVTRLGATRKDAKGKDNHRISEVDGIRRYAVAAINLYGMISYDKLAEFIDHYEMTSEECPSGDRIREGLVAWEEGEDVLCLKDDKVILSAIAEAGAVEVLERMQRNRPYYLPPKEDIEEYFAYYYIPQPKECENLGSFLLARGLEPRDAYRITVAVLEACNVGHELNYLLRLISTPFEEIATSLFDAKTLVNLLIDVRNHTRMVPLRGHTPAELGEAQEHLGKTTGIPEDES